MKSTPTIWTIGHSTREFDEFLSLLKHNDIDILVDVRSLPGSRKFPQFDKENLEEQLPLHSIEYMHLLGLGGRRRARKDSVNTAWRNASFQGYADYMETDNFQQSLQDLKQMSLEKRVCIMCSEAVWWRCHRSMIADILKVQDWKVFHILSIKKNEEHPYTSPAKVVDGKLLYTP